MVYSHAADLLQEFLQQKILQAMGARFLEILLDIDAGI